MKIRDAGDIKKVGIVVNAPFVRIVEKFNLLLILT